MTGSEFIRKQFNVPGAVTLREYFGGMAWQIDAIVEMLNTYRERLAAKNNVSEDGGEGSALPHISRSVPVKGDYIETKCGCGCGTVILVGKWRRGWDLNPQAT